MFTRNNPLLVAALAIFTILAIALPALAEVHDGKTYAIEKAIPKLELDYPFILRESWSSGELAEGDVKIIQHQLYKRNEYWFWIGASLLDSRLNIHIYDSEGNLTDAESFQTANVAGVKVIPSKTGTYYLRIAVESSPVEKTPWAVIYAYR